MGVLDIFRLWSSVGVGSRSACLVASQGEVLAGTMAVGSELLGQRAKPGE